MLISLAAICCTEREQIVEAWVFERVDGRSAGQDNDSQTLRSPAHLWIPEAATMTTR